MIYPGNKVNDIFYNWAHQRDFFNEVTLHIHWEAIGLKVKWNTVNSSSTPPVHMQAYICQPSLYDLFLFIYNQLSYNPL